eukprot:IDg10586t1
MSARCHVRALAVLVTFLAAAASAGDPKVEFCGIKWKDAAKCAVPCPNGDFDCPADERCWSSTLPNALRPCPSGRDDECPGSERCYADANCMPSASPSVSATPARSENVLNTRVDTRFCGTKWRDSGRCELSCPQGVDAQCPQGEYCYGDAPCRATAFPKASPSPARSSSASRPSSLWEWLGPVLGAVATLIAALIAVVCVCSCAKGDRETAACKENENCFSQADGFNTEDSVPPHTVQQARISDQAKLTLFIHQS